MNNIIKNLDKEDLFTLIKGASLFTTGGGVSFEEQIATLSSYPDLSVTLSSLTSLPQSGWVGTVAELGPANAPQIDKRKVVKKMITILQKNTNKKIVGIYPPEIGQESVVIEAAYFLDLPIADFDPVGFRAVPYVDISIFTLNSISYSISPMIITTDNNELIYIDSTISSNRAEEILRQITQLSKTRLIFFIGGLISVKKLIEQNVANNSLSKALHFGKLSFSQFLEKVNPKQVINATIMSIQEKERNGFLYLDVQIKEQQRMLKLLILNEVMFIFDEHKKKVAAVPERILLIDKTNMVGIPSGSLKMGMNISIVIIDAEKEWQSQKAKKLFGEERFRDLL